MRGRCTNALAVRWRSSSPNVVQLLVLPFAPEARIAASGVKRNGTGCRILGSFSTADF